MRKFLAICNGEHELPRYFRFCLVAILAAGTVSASPLLYETNENGNTVGVYTTGGQFVTNLNPALPFSVPYVLITDNSGNVYVSDYSNARVVGFSPTGSEFATFSANLSNPGGLALDAAGNLYVVDRANGNILRYENGSESVVTNVDGARGLAYYGGYLFTASSTSGDVTRFGLDGSSPTVVVSLPGADLRGVAFNSGGDLFLSDVSAGIVYELPFGAATPVAFATGLSGPEYLTLDMSGNLYVPEFFGGTIDLIQANGLSRSILVSGLDHPSAVALSNVPEPGGATMLSLALAVLTARGIRRRPRNRSQK